MMIILELTWNLTWFDPWGGGGKETRDHKWGMKDEFCCPHLRKRYKNVHFRKKKKIHAHIQTDILCASQTHKGSCMHIAVLVLFQNSYLCCGRKLVFFCLCASFTFSPSVAINLWGTEKVVAHARGLHSRSPFPKCFRTHLKGSTSKIFHCELGHSRTKLFRFFRWNSSLQKFKLN